MFIKTCTLVLLALANATDKKGMHNAGISEEEPTETPGFKAADTPKFLQLASDSARKEYVELESNMNVPIGILRKAQDAWAKKIGGSVWTAYQHHMATEDLAKKTEDARMDKIVAELSSAAREADRVIRGIYSNSTLTRKQINAEVSKKMKKLPKKVYNELVLASQ